MTTHQHIAVQKLKRPLAVNSKDKRVTHDGQSEIDYDKYVIINSISSSEGDQNEPAETSSDEGFKGD